MNQLNTISRREAVVLGSRLLAILLSVWALSALSSVPETAYAFIRYAEGPMTNGASEYWKHHYLMVLGFEITRVIGYSLMAAWLFRSGPDIEELLLPAHMRDGAGEIMEE
jgi:hypothetical protein